MTEALQSTDAPRLAEKPADDDLIFMHDRSAGLFKLVEFFRMVNALSDADRARLNAAVDLLADMRVANVPAWQAAAAGKMQITLVPADSAALVAVLGNTPPMGVVGWAPSRTIGVQGQRAIIRVRTDAGTDTRDYRVRENVDGGDDSMTVSHMGGLAHDQTYGYSLDPRIHTVGTTLYLEHHGVGHHTAYAGALAAARVREALDLPEDGGLAMTWDSVHSQNVSVTTARLLVDSGFDIPATGLYEVFANLSQLPTGIDWADLVSVMSGQRMRTLPIGTVGQRVSYPSEGSIGGQTRGVFWFMRRTATNRLLVTTSDARADFKPLEIRRLL